MHVIGLVDGAFPSDMALSTDTGLVEEQRLFYVALTRARDQLTLYTPLRMPHQRYGGSDRHSLAPATRFLTHHVLATLAHHRGRPARPGTPPYPDHRASVPANPRQPLGLIGAELVRTDVARHADASTGSTIRNRRSSRPGSARTTMDHHR